MDSSDEEKKLFPEVHNPFNEYSSFERFDLKKLAFSHFLPPGLLNVEYESVEDKIFDGMKYYLRAIMMGKKLPPHEVSQSRDFVVDVFSSPWDHFKDNHKNSWWLGWWVRKHPSQTIPVKRRVTLTVVWEQFIGFPWQNICSHLDPYSDRWGPAVRFADTSCYWKEEKGKDE
jgi:hypothetical protein